MVILGFLSNVWDAVVSFFESVGESVANGELDSLKEIAATAGTSASGVLTVLCFIIKARGNRKTSAATAKLEAFNTAVQNAVIETEKLSGYSSTEKKAYAMAKVKTVVMEKKLGATDAQISSAIEAAIELSKSVNV